MPNIDYISTHKLHILNLIAAFSLKIQWSVYFLYKSSYLSFPLLFLFLPNSLYFSTHLHSNPFLPSLHLNTFVKYGLKHTVS